MQQVTEVNNVNEVFLKMTEGIKSKLDLEKAKQY
jgi:hypothetical protein